ncbi:rapunzel 4 [Eucyclogobius newberryi]|uniref:rapunzel 4 n=1 Tax=Eucyclogobius newberryi TaxID=166745 RepID=UPI003B5C90BB
MTEQLQKLVADRKDVVENIMEVFEQGAEVVASIAGDLFPVFSIAAPIVRLALDNVESKEAAYMKEQFKKVRERLEVVSEQMQRINDEIKKSGVDAAYFSVEENITNQFRKYMDILNAKPKFREVKKKLFLEHFAKTGGDKNLQTLYNAVTGDNFSGESVLEITMNYEEKSRRTMEDFCARMKKLFCVGLIALLGHAALKDYGEEEQLLQEWNQKMQTVQKRMNAVIEDCIVSFPKLAEQDSCRVVRDQPGLSCQQLAQAILDKLKQRYDWVFWSVRVFRSPSGLLAKKREFHCPTGKSRFQVPSSEDRLNVVVSYSSSSEPVDRARVSELVLGQKKVSVVSTAELLFRELPGDSVVHTIKTKELACCSSFSPELHYWEEHSKVFVCVHSA